MSQQRKLSRPIGTIDAILMASGASRRFAGENKLLAHFRGEPLAAHTLRLAAGLGVFQRILLVCAEPAVAALAQGLPVEVVSNAHPERGQRESIRLGVASSRADHYLFFPCDQPLLDAATVHAILAEGGKGRIAAPSHRGSPGNPVLFSAAFREELLALAPGESARVLKARHPGAVTAVPIDSPFPLADVDTAEDLYRLAQSGIACVCEPPVKGATSWHSK